MLCSNICAISVGGIQQDGSDGALYMSLVMNVACSKL